MNLLEARIVMKCRNIKQARDIWLDFRNLCQDYSYNYIVNRCSQLAYLGYLIKKEINHGKERGRKTFYTATPQSVVEAMNVIESFVKGRQTELQRSSGNNIANLIRYTTSDRR